LLLADGENLSVLKEGGKKIKWSPEIIPKLSRLARGCENARTRLIIVPALNEARFDYPLPQPPLNSVADRIPLWDSLVKELPTSVMYASNPCTLEIDNLKILVTSTDALSAINSNILFKQDSSESSSLARVDQCLHQLLQARSLFPVMPSSLRIEPSLRHCLDIDESQFPHLIIIPSLSGKKFIKKIKNRVFINPGFRSDSTGSNSSIAELVIQPGFADIETRVNGELIKL
jgi:hypothetical protein